MRASEGGHWYDRTGKPVYECPYADGSGSRPVTLRDARKMLLVPGTTSVIKCAAAPGLERWKLDQMLHAALTLPRQPDEKEEDWIGRIWLDSAETAKKAAEKGTAIHAAIEGYFTMGHIPVEGWVEHCIGSAEEIFRWADGAEWVSETSFASQLGYGGKVDLNSAGFVLDVKTKEFDENTDLKTWAEQHMQLAAYREGLRMPTAKAAICYVSVNNPGLARLIEVPEKDLKTGWECFKALLAYWKAKNHYDSSFLPLPGNSVP